MENKLENNKKPEKPKKKKDSIFKYFLHDFVWGIGSVFGYIWFRPKKYYISEAAKKKIKGGAILISNHIGFYDPVYIMISINYRRHHFVATKELFSSKFKKFMFEKIFLCISIDRNGVGTGTIRKIVGELKKGSLVSMFPEGHINVNKKDEVEAFKSGAVFMALKGGCPIVPVYIHKRKNIFKRLVTIVGEPIKVSLDGTDKPAMEYINDVTLELRKKEQELENYYKRIVGRD